MSLIQIIIVTVWVSIVIDITAWVIFRKILPPYRVSTSDISFSELLSVLNAAINTELELWEKDIFKEQPNAIGTNSRYENFYHEISMHIVETLSPSFFLNMSKYMTEEAVVSLIGRRVKIFLNDHTSTI